MAEFVGRQTEARNETQGVGSARAAQCYTAEDVADTPWSDIGWPGRGRHARATRRLYRGPHASGRCGRSRLGTGGRDTQRPLKYLIAQGTKGLSCDFEYADARHDSRRRTVARRGGTRGRAVAPSRTVEALFRGDRLETISVSMGRSNRPAWILLACNIAVATGRAARHEPPIGHRAGDILKEYSRQKSGSYRPPVRAADARH